MAAVALRPSLQVEDEDAESQTFVAVVEKQGACEFQIRPAVDGTPHLYASPTAESRASVIRIAMKHCRSARLILSSGISRRIEFKSLVCSRY
jgi:hypothetical protein